MKEQMQRITLPKAVVDNLKETAWQLDMSVPELMSLIIQTASHRPLDTKADADLEIKEGWKQLRQSVFRNPPRWLGRRRRNTREETTAEDGQWILAEDGLLTISLPLPKYQRDRLQELGRERGTSAEEEVSRIVQEAVKHDYRPRSEEEWVKENKAMMHHAWRSLRDLCRYVWSSRSKRR